MTRFAGLAVACLFAAAPAVAQQNVADQIINVPAPGALTLYGLPAAPKPHKDAGVQGGQALRVAIPAASDQPYSIGLISQIVKPVKKGDKLLIAFWGRQVKGDTPTAKVANVQVSLAKAPYTAVFRGEADLGADWKMNSVQGRADRDYAAGEIVVTLHLATGTHTIDVGPVFLLDLGA